MVTPCSIPMAAEKLLLGSKGWRDDGEEIPTKWLCHALGTTQTLLINSFLGNQGGFSKKASEGSVLDPSQFSSLTTTEKIPNPQMCPARRQVSSIPVEGLGFKLSSLHCSDAAGSTCCNLIKISPNNCSREGEPQRANLVTWGSPGRQERCWNGPKGEAQPRGCQWCGDVSGAAIIQKSKCYSGERWVRHEG